MRPKSLSLRSILFIALALPIASASSAPRTLTEQEKATHVLNRLAFGPRPGDGGRTFDIKDDPVVKSSARRIRVFNDQCEGHRLRRNAFDMERRIYVISLAGVFDGDVASLGKGRTCDLQFAGCFGHWIDIVCDVCGLSVRFPERSGTATDFPEGLHKQYVSAQ